MNRFNPAEQSEESEVNLTPMLDVVFILLVFFVVTASFIREAGIPVALPAGYAQPAPDIESIVVTVDPASSFAVNGRPVSRGGLLPYLRWLYSENPDAGFAILADDKARVEDTVIAADAGRILGFDVIVVGEKN